MATRNPPQARQRRGPSGMDLWELSYGTALAEVVPARGGLVTRFSVDGDEVLYLDPRTLADRSQNVRGGIPVLFPIAGRLTGDRYTANGQSYPMRQHGLARQAAWSVISVSQARLAMEFRSSEATLVNFPFAFSLRLTVDLGRAGGRTLALEHEVENLSDVPLPLHLGFHPYFAVPDADKAQVRVETSARTAYDNVRGETVPFPDAGVDFSTGEVDLHLLDHGRPGTTLTLPRKPPRVLGWSEMYRVLVLWTQHYKDFVCVEPWSAPGDALNTGAGLVHVPPKQTVKGWFLITV